MKRTYPDYKDMSIVFNKLSKTNQTIISKFLTNCSASAGKTSVRKIYHKIVQIVDILDKDLNKINEEDIVNFLSLLNNSKRSTDTINDTKKILKRFLKWKYLDWSKRFHNFDRLKSIQTKRKPDSERLSSQDLLSKEDVEMLIRGTKENKIKTIISILYETGCRPEELLSRKWKDINFRNEEIYFISAKTGKSRTLPIRESVIRLKNYREEYPTGIPKDEDFLFPSPHGEDHISVQLLNHLLKPLGKKILNKNVFPYLFRHSRLKYIKSKLSPDTYEYFSGHSIEVAQEHYKHLENEDLIKEMNEKIFNIESLTQEKKEEIQKLKEQISKDKALILLMFEKIAEAIKNKKFDKTEHKGLRELIQKF